MSADAQSQAPRTSLRQAYEKCLQARRQWMSVRGRTADDEVREEAHADLHETTMAWFEALVPYIAERPGEVKQLWESAPLYPLEPKLTQGLKCGDEENCGAAYHRAGDDDDRGLAPGDQCPACGMPLEPAEVPDVDDEGRVLYTWACGLKRLSNWSNKTETKHVDGGEWSTETETIEVPKRLNPTVLMRAARYLDLAAEECGLLEDTDRALAVGEL